MQITFKTITQEVFKIEAEPNDTVQQLKQKIEKLKGYVVNSQRFIYAGDVLNDQRAVSDLKYDEKTFIVLILSIAAKKNAAADVQNIVKNAAIAPMLKVTESKQEEVPEAMIDQLTNMGFKKEDAVVALVATSNDIDQAIECLTKQNAENRHQDQAHEYPQQNQKPVEQEVSESAIAEIVGMGFEREKVVEAFKQSSNNYDQAMEYLVRAPSSKVTADEIETKKKDFEQLQKLRTNPMFINLRYLIRTNPQLFPDIKRQIGESNPETLKLIERNEDKFMEMMKEPLEVEKESDQPKSQQTSESNQIGTNAVHICNELNDQDRQAINRLMGMGFAEDISIEAYLTCDKNEQLAVSMLLEQTKM